MKRREFIKLSIVGSMTLFFSGCGLSALAENKEENKAPVKGEVSGGNKMKIVVISSSPHSKETSTSYYLASRFIEGAEKAGHEVFTFDAGHANLNPCTGCDKCGMDGPCIWEDDISTTLMPKMLEADMLVLATPLYYYGMSAQLKMVIDRFYSKTGSLHGKKSLLITTAYNTADWTMEAICSHYETLVRYMEWQDTGQVLGIGCGSRPAVERSNFGDIAYKMGETL